MTTVFFPCFHYVQVADCITVINCCCSICYSEKHFLFLHTVFHAFSYTNDCSKWQALNEAAIRMDKHPGNAATRASCESLKKAERLPDDAMAAPSYQTRERVKKSSKEVTVAASIEGRERIDKSSGNTTSGATYTTLDSISECDHIELHTGNSRDPLPLPSPMDTAMAEEKDRLFPPMS